MGLFNRPSPAKELLDDLVYLADACGFWVIRKRPRLLKTFKVVAWGSAAIFLAVFLSTFGAYITLRFYTWNIPYLGDLKDDPPKPERKPGMTDDQFKEEVARYRARRKPLDWSKLGRSDYKKQESIARAKDGPIVGRYFVEVRDPVKIGEVPPLLVKGFVAAEDQRFYSHSGVDFKAMGRASFIQLLHWGGLHYGQKSGASGISQQTSRQTYADEVESFRNLEQNLPRKVKEARVAFQLEKRYSKDRIMEVFLNSIYFGHGVNGVAEAALFYFGKDLRKDKLTLREIAILVSLDKSAIKYCPMFHEPVKPDMSGLSDGDKDLQQAQYQKEMLQEMRRITLARDRYSWVLGRMLDDGYINRKDYQAALFSKDDPPNLAMLHITQLKTPEFGHGSRMVKELLLVQGFKDDDITYRSGLRIKTSFDTSIQGIVSEELERQYQELNREIKTEEKIEGAAVVIENKTGKIVALVGSHNFEETQFNRTLSLRSPGSVFKPFTYAAAFENRGKTFNDMICNCSFSLPDKIDVHGRVLKLWAPKNFKEKNAVPTGYIPLPIGLIRSVNLATLDLARQIGGAKPVIKMANRLGVSGYKDEAKDPEGKVWFKRPGANDNQKGLEPYLPTVIGGSGASLLELTSAFSDFARGGTYVRPSIIQEIRDSAGSVLYKAPLPKEERVLSEETSRKITVLLRAVTKIGTAKISMRGIRQQVAVKTGTSNGPEDLSMIGYTPDYTIGIRFGYDLPKTIEIPQYMKRVSHGGELQVSGGWVAGPVWRKMVDRIYEKRGTVDFPPEVEDGLKEIIARFGSY